MDFQYSIASFLEKNISLMQFYRLLLNFLLMSCKNSYWLCGFWMCSQCLHSINNFKDKNKEIKAIFSSKHLKQTNFISEFSINILMTKTLTFFPPKFCFSAHITFCQMCWRYQLLKYNKYTNLFSIPEKKYPQTRMKSNFIHKFIFTLYNIGICMRTFFSQKATPISIFYQKLIHYWI